MQDDIKNLELVHILIPERQLVKNQAEQGHAQSPNVCCSATVRLNIRITAFGRKKVECASRLRNFISFLKRRLQLFTYSKITKFCDKRHSVLFLLGQMLIRAQQNILRLNIPVNNPCLRVQICEPLRAIFYNLNNIFLAYKFFIF